MAQVTLHSTPFLCYTGRIVDSALAKYIKVYQIATASDLVATFAA